MMNWHNYRQYYQDKLVVVTGAAGFLGSHLVDHLLTAGATVIGVDNFISGREQNLDQARQHDQFTFIEADVSQPFANFLDESQPLDCLFHLASPASPPHYQQHPVETYLVNSIGTHHALSFIKAHVPQARFLFSSTSEVYGDPEVHPQPESYRGNVNPNGPRACYDESKRLGESISGVFERDFGIDVRLIRIFNTYGPRVNPADGRVIPDFIAQALKNEPLNVFGDGSQTRSFCYVDDLIDGILRMMAGDQLKGSTVNLGNPEEKTILQTAELITQQLGSKSEIEFKPLPKDDPTRRQPDISLAKELLEWTPQIGFEEGIARTAEFFRENE